MRTLKALTGFAAAASLAFAGVAHAEGTKSVNMLPKSSLAKRGAAPAEGTSKIADDEKGSSGIILLLLGGGALVGGLVALSSTGDGGDTPG